MCVLDTIILSYVFRTLMFYTLVQSRTISMVLVRTISYTTTYLRTNRKRLHNLSYTLDFYRTHLNTYHTLTYNVRRTLAYILSRSRTVNTRIHECTAHTPLDSSTLAYPIVLSQIEMDRAPGTPPRTGNRSARITQSIRHGPVNTLCLECVLMECVSGASDVYFTATRRVISIHLKGIT